MLTPRSVLVRENARMLEILQRGLNPVYTDFNDFLYDYFSDFSWDASRNNQFKALLASPHWCELAKKIKATHGHDFVAEINKALIAPLED